MESEGLKDFIVIPREYFRARERGELSDLELLVLIWLRSKGRPDGTAGINNTQLANMLPVKRKPNTIGKTLKSLRNHGYIDFEDHQGVRSGFKVRFDEWPLGKGKVQRLKRIKTIDTITSGGVANKPDESKNNAEVEDKNHKFSDQYINCKTAIKTVNGSKSIGEIITSRYNDSYTNSNTNDRISVKKTKVSEFVPSSYVDDRLKRVAESVGEEYMGFAFSIYRDFGEEGINLMEKIAANLSDYPSPRNKPALFNSRVREELGLCKNGNEDE